MQDYSQGSFSRDIETGSSTSTAEAERRTGDRHAITAVAEVADLASGAVFLTHTSDIGRGGCFVDSLNPLPIGSTVCVTVRQGETEFEINGAVVYSQGGLGMGIAFDELAYEQRLELEGWLVEVAGLKHLPPGKQFTPKPPLDLSEMSHAALVRLVETLVSKRVLMNSEAEAILLDPIL